MLGQFLGHVRSGRIEKGSYLIVESMDRLSREAVMQALPRFIDILNAGIVVVTLTDGQVYSKESIDENPYQIMVSLGPMIRSHEESAVKSIRVSQAWGKKRALARAGEHKLTRRAPEWLELINGEFRLRDERVEIVRRVFRETIEGRGRRTIARRLNLEGVPTFRAHEKRKRQPTGWQDSSIAKILNSRAVFGEFQPGTGTKKYGTHKPEGEPIKGYYPVAVDEATFWEAQRVIASRRRVTDAEGNVIQRGAAGRRGNGIAHLLIGLGRCDRCGDAMHQINKGASPKGGLYLECSTARRKAGCDNTNRWRVDAIERRLLKHLAYIDADAVLRGETPRGEVEKIEGLKARLADVEKRARNRAAMMEAADDLDEESLRRHRELIAEAASIRTELAEAEKALAQAIADPGLKARLADAVDLTRAMDEAEGEERTAIRTRLAEQLRQLVEVLRFHPSIGVDAILRARPDVPLADVPFVIGGKGRVPWRLDLTDDDDPHGTYVWDLPPDDEQPQRNPLPLLRAKVAARKAAEG